MTSNLDTVAARFRASVEQAELAWARRKADTRNPRLLARYIRSLRRCARLRAELAILLETGSL